MAAALPPLQIYNGTYPRQIAQGRADSAPGLPETASLAKCFALRNLVNYCPPVRIQKFCKKGKHHGGIQFCDDINVNDDYDNVRTTETECDWSGSQVFIQFHIVCNCESVWGHVYWWTCVYGCVCVVCVCVYV